MAIDGNVGRQRVISIGLRIHSELCLGLVISQWSGRAREAGSTHRWRQVSEKNLQRTC